MDRLQLYFKDLREQLEKLRSLAPEYLGDSSEGEEDSSEDEDVEPGAVRGMWSDSGVSDVEC